MAKKPASSKKTKAAVTKAPAAAVAATTNANPKKSTAMGLDKAKPAARKSAKA